MSKDFKFKMTGDEPVEIKMTEYTGNRDHAKLHNRDLPNQHPISAISGLDAALSKMETDVDMVVNFKDEIEVAAKKAIEGVASIDESVRNVTAGIARAGEEANAAVSAANSAALREISARGESMLEGFRTSISSGVSQVEHVLEEANEVVAQAGSTIEGYTESAEAWASGTRGGDPVSDDDPAYHNNAKYYAELAQGTTGGGPAYDDTEIRAELSDVKKDLSELALLVDDEGYICLGGLYE